MEKEKNSDFVQKNPMVSLLKYIMPHWKLFSWSCFSSIFNKILDLMPPILVGWVIDSLRREPPKWISNFLDPEIKCVAFLDPPFSSNEYDTILKRLSILSSVKKGSFIVVQSPQSRKILIPKNLEILKQRHYGSVMIYILKKC